jgi:hypothetical protein
LELYRVSAKYHSLAFEYFDFDKLDAFHNQEVLTVVYGKNWDSVLITEDEKAFLHAFSKQEIGDFGWYDIEPLIGYGGAVVNTSDVAFIGRALEAYSAFCREEKIIAEIMRFNCLLGNHACFENVFPLYIVPVKEIVIIECVKNEALQLQQFNEPCRRRVKKGRKECEFRVLDKEKEWEMFIRFYFNSLERVAAQKIWYFSSDFFERARQSKYFNVYGVWYKKQLASASLVIEYPLSAYYLLAGNSDDLVPGASELLIFGISQAIADKSIHNLILGGGNSSELDDPLLRFKKKFSKARKTFYLGKMVHDQERFAIFCGNAIKINSEIGKSSFFLKYRLMLQ